MQRAEAEDVNESQASSQELLQAPEREHGAASHSPHGEASARKSPVEGYKSMTLWHGPVVLAGTIRSKKELLQLPRKLFVEAGQRAIIRPQRDTKVHILSAPAVWMQSVALSLG